MTTSIYKVAKLFEQKMMKLASNLTLQQLSVLSQAATALWKGRKTWEDAALGGYNSDDPYEQDAGAPARAKNALHLVDSIYFASIGLKQNATNFGMSKSEIAQRVNQIGTLCSQLAALTMPNGHPGAFQVLDGVRKAVMNVIPESVQPSNVIVTPEQTIVGDKPKAQIGEAYQAPQENNSAYPFGFDQSADQQAGTIENKNQNGAGGAGGAGGSF